MKNAAPPVDEKATKPDKVQPPVKLKTEFPLSEKDETKAAEYKLRKGQKKHL